ncbi:unnamed protein product [Mytilus edulis]|uniref:DZIP3-like HEPN domain-containing protein n=1 Tax=Mytilus edulis TaxID=6550 RepID=A0A8S3RCY1_MYTED|nr:unnamed protein product [Mytilus edulis]
MQVTELELNTIDTLLKSNCFDMFCDDCLLNSRLENVLNSHKEELFKIYQNSDTHHNVSHMFTEQYTPSLTKYEWELLFKTGDLWGFNEEGYDHYISASKDITLSSLDINLRYSILYIICPLFKSVHAISECQIQIAKIAVLQTELKYPQFDIWDTIEAQIVIIGRHCKLFDYFQRKCTTIKNTKFNRSLSQENRKYILVHAFKNPIFLQDREFCERTRKELELIKFEENLNMAEKLLGREITIELEDGKYEIGSYSRRVIDIADMQKEINKHNHLKLVQLITSFGNNVLVDVLKQRLPDAEFGYAFKGMRSRIIPLLDNHEQQLLYPDRGHYKGDLSDLDISLVYIILRNLNTICPHRNGWGNKPNDDDRCLSANIERIRIFKNMYVSHCSNYSLNDEDFLMTWKEIRQCILQLGGTAYTEKIDSSLTTEINPIVAKELYNTLEKLKAAKIQNEKYTVILEEYQHDLKQQSNIIHRQHSENTPTHNGSLGKGNVSLKLKMEGQNIPSVKNIEDLIQDTTTDDVRIVYANDGSILIGLEVSPSVFLKIGVFLDRIDKLLSSLLQRYPNYGNGQTSRVIVFVDFTDTCNESLDDGEPSFAIEGDRDNCLERTGMPSSEWKTLLNETFEDRCLPFDNTLSGNASVEQVSILLQKVGQIISANTGNSCTHEDFKKAEQLIQQEKIFAKLSREREAWGEEFMRKTKGDIQRAQKELEHERKLKRNQLRVAKELMRSDEEGRRTF